MSGRLMGQTEFAHQFGVLCFLAGKSSRPDIGESGPPALFEVTFTLCEDLRVGKGRCAFSCLSLPELRVPDKSCRSAYVIGLGKQLQRRLFDR